MDSDLNCGFINDVRFDLPVIVAKSFVGDQMRGELSFGFGKRCRNQKQKLLFWFVQ